ncbi:hypothetical protein ACJD0Z_00785 [Flavobacteriaceae bacterium M23B6Z8]
MNTPTKAPILSVGRILCLFFGHRFIVTKKVTAHINEYECSCCRKQVTVDVQGNLASLTPQLKEINETLALLHQKRMAHTHRPAHSAA